MAMIWEADEMAQHWVEKLNNGTDAMACLFLDPDGKADMSYLGNRRGVVAGGKLSRVALEKLKHDFHAKMRRGFFPVAVYTIVLNEQIGFELHGSESLFELHGEGLTVLCETVLWEGLTHTPGSLGELRTTARRIYDRHIKPFVEELVVFKQIAETGATIMFNQGGEA
jgi:hypothetical protein